MAPRFPRPLAFWFLALGLLAVARVGVRHARGAEHFTGFDAAWLAGGAVLLVVGLVLLLRRARVT